MIRNRILLKTLAVFFLLEMLGTAVVPAVSWALTSGPTAPEATSFEPVDTTDMVNLSTGDLAYNLPLLEVPGPSGGYPLSLSYHAGIQPNEEASWAGLGFTINPGAISRNVNGFADDQLNNHDGSRYFWAGGHTETYGIGVSVGLAETPISVSAGLSYSQDTYQGTGVGGYLGVGYQLEGSGIGIGASIGVSPYDGPYASAGVTLSAPIGAAADNAAKLSVGVGVTTNSEGVGFYGTVGIDANYGSGNKGTQSVLGATISTGSHGINANVSVAGVNVSSNSQSTRLQTDGNSFDIPIPVWYGVWVNHSYSYQRYWIDEFDGSLSSGALNYPANTQELKTSYFDNHAYDTYSLLDPNLDGGIINNPNADKVLGGSFPSYDNYLVVAQGLSGYMRPYNFQRHLYKRNGYTIDENGNKVYDKIQYDISKSHPGESSYRSEFRFINDFSNRVEFDPGQINQNSSDDNNPLLYNFSDGNNLRIDENAISGYASNNIQGSRKIDWFTNEEIVNNDPKIGNAGFMETISSGFVRSTPDDDSDDKNIGGFTIVNESGVKYHFALPAYTYQEYFYSGNKANTDKYNDFEKGGKYAYTWYLTGITGPDYVDRGADGQPDGKFNEFDWGYWVEFEYGKWTDYYPWRNPSEGTHSDLDSDFGNFSEGIKEIYYLDAIRTKTHTALFVKDIREDSKSTIHYIRNYDSEYIGTYDDGYFTKNNAPHLPAKALQGGFIPQHETCSCSHDRIVYTAGGGKGHGETVYVEKGTGDYVAKPTSTLKLVSILLLDNSSLDANSYQKGSGIDYAQQTQISWNVTSQANKTDLHEQCDFTSLIQQHLYQNVYDVHDDARVSLRNKALRIIDFDTDQSLCQGTSNSFDFTPLRGEPPPTDDNSYQKSGKLTLNKISFLGKTGSPLLPPIVFHYDLKDPIQGTSYLVKDGDTYYFNEPNSELEAGDIIKFDINTLTYYAVITEVNNDKYSLKFLNDSIPNSSNVDWVQTKNPPYNKDYFDIWGLYKSDFDLSSIQEGDQVARRVTSVSAKSLDVWSLRRITTTSGASIELEYEPDTYVKPALHQSSSLIVTDIQKINSTQSKISLLNSYPELDKIIESPSLDYLFFFTYPCTTCSPFGTGGNTCFTNYTRNIKRGTIILDDLKLENGYWTILTSTNLDQFYITPSTSPGLNTTCSSTPIFIAGNISVLGDVYSNGGGLRVKSIQTQSLNYINKTNYSYNNPNDEPYQYSSGVTSYEPVGLDQAYFNYHGYDYLPTALLEDSYKKVLYNSFSNLLANAREVPAPGVLYKYVNVSESVIKNGVENKIPQTSTYEFEVFDESLVKLLYDNDQVNTFSQKKYENYIDYSQKKSRNVTLKDYTSRVGSLKKITLYDDNQKISETANIYLHDYLSDDAYETELNDSYNNQGVIEESYSDARFVSRPGSDFELQGVITKREQYPAIQIGQTTINYKTGITTSVTRKAFDYYSGQTIQTLSSDGYGNTYLSETVPAYRKYEEMGLGVNGGKNMLTQEAANYMYKVSPTDVNTKLGLVSASVQTWSDQTPSLYPGLYSSYPITQSGIWRMQSSYSWKGDDMTLNDNNGGLYPASSFSEFNFSAGTNGTNSTQWQKNAEITLYDVNSHALSATDLNGKSGATKMDFDHKRMLATAANCEYRELAYSGAEEKPQLDQFNLSSFGGNVYCSGTWNSEKAHTGSYSVKAAVGNAAYTYYFVPKAGPYVVSFWSSQPDATLKYQLDESTPKEASLKKMGQAGAGGWYLFEAVISDAGGYDRIKIWNEAKTAITYFDDFRVHPFNSSMVSYVYTEWGELSHILNNQNMYTKYEYDEMGRLKKSYKETFVKGEILLNETKYHYAGQ